MTRGLLRLRPLRSALCAALLCAPGPLQAQAADPNIPDSTLVALTRAAWQVTGRLQVATWSGYAWDTTTGGWRPDSARLARLADAASAGYDTELVLEGLVALAEATGDRGLLDEAAGFYLAYLPRFETLGSLRKRAQGLARRSTSYPIGPGSYRLLPWVDRLHEPAVPSECVLCSAQFLYPAARLVRLAALVPSAQRSPTLVRFVQAYRPLLLRDHLIRLGYLAVGRLTRVPGLSDTLVTRWEQLGAGVVPKARRDLWNIRDTDLWLLAAAAELVGAAQADPQFAPLDREGGRLRRMVRAGDAFLRRSTTLHPGTTDWSGNPVGSLGYFEGDFDAHPEMAYAADTDSVLPTPDRRRPPTQGSWDVSHLRRLPIVLRALWDTRGATGVPFPSRDTLVLTVNQFLYRAAQPGMPGEFNNFFDGRNGWYRVGYEGKPTWAYPPSQWCVARGPDRPCLARGAVGGWGRLAFVSPELERYYQRLFAVTQDTSAAVSVERERLFATSWDLFRWPGPRSGTRPSFLLFLIGSEYLLGRRAVP